MTHPHSDQRSITVCPHPTVLSPYSHLVNAPVSPLDMSTSALIPQHYSGSPPAVDGEVITSTVVIPAAPRHHTNARMGPIVEPKRTLLRRVIDDPYWILMTLTIALRLSITATAVYGVIQITVAIAEWLHTNGATLGAIITLAVLLMLCGGATAAKCAGIHCGGCRG